MSNSNGIRRRHRIQNNFLIDGEEVGRWGEDRRDRDCRVGNNGNREREKERNRFEKEKLR